MQIFNVYCDESCHLENDGQRAMVFGAVWSAIDRREEITHRLREIRERHGMPPDFEFKWTKVSGSKVQMYLDVVDYFFDNDDMHFRCLVVPDKNVIDHQRFNQKHDDWYYKQYFNMLKIILKPTEQYNIYLDIKDTRSKFKVRKLHDVLCNNAYDFSREVIHKVQQIRSHEAMQSQVADLLIGAMSYKARGLSANSGKNAIIGRIAERSGYSLSRNTLYKEEKFNILYWQGDH